MNTVAAVRWYECDDRCIAAHHQPAVLVDLALERGIDSHRLLRGTGLFLEQIASGDKQMTPQQFLTLIGNTQRLLAADDTPFLFGQRLLPGHYGAASHALQHSANLYEALIWLEAQRTQLSPLLRPRLQLDDKFGWLHWHDSYGASEQRQFLLESAMTAVVSASRWLSGEKLPWRFHFSATRPRYIEQYWVHLGEQLHFDQPINAMALPREQLFQPWPSASPTAGQAARRQAAREHSAAAANTALLDLLFDHLLEKIREQPQLESVAEHFDISAATLKRKLQKHGTHFQAELDKVRAQVAVWLYRSRGFSNEEVAAYLRFNDAANFRRSFKRWTGFAPSALRALLPPG